MPDSAKLGGPGTPTAGLPPARISSAKRLLFQIAISLLGLILLEGVLRIAGFEYHNIPRYVEFADDPYREQARHEGQFDFVSDKRLFWRMTPNNPRLLTNARGYRGDDFPAEKPRDVTRIISLGCSCTFGIGSSYTYDMALQKFLNQNELGKRYQVINAGVPGYSSLQGLRLLQSEILGFHPDLITVFFGWNDHWLARHFQDKDQKTPTRVGQFVLDHAAQVRLIQLLLRAAAMLHGPTEGKGDSAPYRVSPSDYRRNLEAMVAEAKSHDIRIALLTAPAAYTQPADVSGHLVDDRFATSRETVLQLHRQYNDIVRGVAREMGVVLVDCAAGFDANPEKKTLFNEDGIHPNNYGQWLIGVDLFRELLKAGWVDRSGYRPEFIPPEDGVPDGGR